MQGVLVSLLLFALPAPVVLAVLVYIFRADITVRNICIVTIPVLLLGCLSYSFFLYHDNFGPSPLESAMHLTLLHKKLGSGLIFKMVVEPMGLIFSLIAAMLWLPNMIYTIGYTRTNNEEGQCRLFVLLALSMTCVLGVAFAGNLFTLFIFYELLTILTYPLVTHSRSNVDKAVMSSGRIYLFELMMSSVSIFLLLMIFIQKKAGMTDFMIGGLLHSMDGSIVTIVLVMCAYGVAKAASFPLHSWLPVAMVAPTPVSAFLHAVAVVKVGVFTVMKLIVYVIGLDNVRKTMHSSFFGSTNALLFIACATIIWAMVQAVRQTEIKKILAYSTMGQLSYIAGTASLATQGSIRAAVFHMAAHGCAKITMFFAAGAIYTMARVSSYKDMHGIGMRMPISMLCFGIGALSLVGVPPTAGYMSKMNILFSVASSFNLVFMSIIILSTAITSLYTSRIILISFFSSAQNPVNHIKEAPIDMLLPMLFTSCATIILYFMPGTFLLSL